MMIYSKGYGKRKKEHIDDIFKGVCLRRFYFKKIGKQLFFLIEITAH